MMQNDSGVDKKSGGQKAALLATLLLILCALYVHFVAGDVGDRDWLLLAARMWLSGKQLYRDIFEVNPPLIVWMYALPVFLSLHLGFLKDYQFLVVMGAGVVGLSIAVCDRLLHFHPELGRDIRLRHWHVLLLALVFIAYTSPPAFMDREHIFLLLVFPYLLRFMPSLASIKLPLTLRITIGVMAGIGFCIKPYCAIVFAAVQIIGLLRTRGLVFLRATESLIVCGIAILYCVAVFILYPDYIHRVLPMAMATYNTNSVRVNGLFYGVLALVILGVAFADFRRHAESPYRPDIYYLLSLLPAFLLYALMGNGWGYMYNPLIILTLVITGWMGAEYLWLKCDAESQGRTTRSSLMGARACVLSLSGVVICTVALGFFTITEGCTEHLKCNRWGREIIGAMDGAHSFGTMSGNFDIWTRLSDATGAEWQTRFNHLWMMPKFFIADNQFKKVHQDIPDYVANALAEDMDSHKPDVMFVDNADVFYLTPVHVDLVAYFSAYPAFAEAWQHYRHVQSISTCSEPLKRHCNFEVYRRVP